MDLTCLTFHTSFLNLAVTTFFSPELWLALTLWRGREDHFLLHSWESCSQKDRKGEGSQSTAPKDAPNTALSCSEGLKGCVFISLARWAITNFPGQWERAPHQSNMSPLDPDGETAKLSLGYVCLGDCISVTAPTAWDYQWKPGEFLPWRTSGCYSKT